MKSEELASVLNEYGCVWGDHGLDWDKDGQPSGYLYPIVERGNCIDRSISSKQVAEILATADDYVINKDGYIDIY